MNDSAGVEASLAMFLVLTSSGPLVTGRSPVVLLICAESSAGHSVKRLFETLTPQLARNFEVKMARMPCQSRGVLRYARNLIFTAHPVPDPTGQHRAAHHRYRGHEPAGRGDPYRIVRAACEVLEAPPPRRGRSPLGRESRAAHRGRSGR